MSTNESPLVTSVTDILAESVALRSQRILDVGCGNGGLVRWLAGKGARPTGLETQRGLVEEARILEPVASEEYVEGRGEGLPFDEATFDIVLFSNSLHHVPVAFMRDALREANRVLCPKGLVIVIEPVADGDYFEVMRLIDDETEVRGRALEALRDVSAHGLLVGDEKYYRMRRCYESAAQFLDHTIEVDPERRAIVEANRGRIEERFYRHGVPGDRGYCFEMEFRSNRLSKTAPREGGGRVAARRFPADMA